jgi:aspartokinase-like uncharacterized kinase
LPGACNVNPLVIKVTGSLIEHPRCDEWLQAIPPLAPVVIVPGGGRHADAVRSAQPSAQFSDRHAHRMALRAMGDIGRELASRCSFLVEAHSLSAVRAALAAQQTPLWLPDDLLGGHPDIEESWDVTSDSLAAWCAGQIHARGCILLKAGPVPGDGDCSRWAETGFVDRRFPDYVSAAALPWQAVSIRDERTAWVALNAAVSSLA